MTVTQWIKNQREILTRSQFIKSIAWEVENVNQMVASGMKSKPVQWRKVDRLPLHLLAHDVRKMLVNPTVSHVVHLLGEDNISESAQNVLFHISSRMKVSDKDLLYLHYFYDQITYHVDRINVYYSESTLTKMDVSIYHKGDVLDKHGNKMNSFPTKAEWKYKPME